MPSLTHAQRALWLLAQLIPPAEQGALNLCYELVWRGPLDRVALTRAVAAAAARHPALATRLRQRRGEVWQRLDGVVELAHIDLGGSPDPAAEAGRIARREARRGMDLDGGSLVAFLLLRLGPENHRLVMNLHHMVADGLSIHRLRSDLAALYGVALGERPPDPAVDGVQRRAYLSFLHCHATAPSDPGLVRGESFWRRALGAELAPLALTTDFRPARRSFRGAGLETVLGGELLNRCVRRGARLRAPVSAVLLSAFVLLLRQLGGQARMILGTSFAGRRGDRAWHRSIGFFANTVPLAFDLSGLVDTDALVRHVSERFVAAHDHQDYPMQLLIERLSPPRDARRPVLFQVAFNYQNTVWEPVVWPGAEEIGCRRVHTPTSIFELLLHVTTTAEGAVARFEYCTDLFRRETIAGLAEHYCSLLSDLAAGCSAVDEPTDFTAIPEVALR